MTHNLKSILASIVLFLMVACASKPTVYSDFDPRHDFSNDRTFTWAQRPPMLRSGDHPVSELAETRMTAGIKAELIMKGYQFVEDQADADFSVLYTMGAREKIEIIGYPNPYYDHENEWGWGEHYFPYFVNFPFRSGWPYEEEVNHYTDGTIALDIFDTKTKQPIWHTKASKRLSKRDLDSDAKNAEKIAMMLLQHFPWRGCTVEISDECQPFEGIE